MKQDPSFSRYTVLWVVILCYLLPLICLSTYSTATGSWNVLSLGLFLTTTGALAIFWVMLRWETRFRPPKNRSENDATEEATTPAAAVEHAEDLSIALSDAVERLKELEILKAANDHMRAEIDTLAAQAAQQCQDKEQAQLHDRETQAEWENYRQQTCRQMEQQQAHIQALQETIAEQKAAVEKKQQQIGTLEAKTGDLTYEIKTLLQLAEAYSGSLHNETHHPSPSYASSSFMSEYPQEEPPNPPPERQIRSSEEASLQLKRCLDIAQKITGSHRFNSQFNAFLDSPADGFALDLRRLCDSLRSENNSTILLYSPKENQLLFANNQIRILAGWSPDKFVQNFSDIIQDVAAWRQGIASLSMRSEAHIQLPLKTKSGHDINVQAHFGAIPTGIFRQHVIAVLYQNLSAARPL